jgi:penicillin amidase
VLKKSIRIISFITIAFAFSILTALYFLFQGSLPIQNGEFYIEGLSGPVDITRDHRGIPSINALNRNDIASALGFLHSQDRFFQMDLMRRAAAGELSELFGIDALSFDKERRLHQFRKVSKKAWELLSDKEKALLKAYAKGVNKGLRALKVRPFEYLVLGLEPDSWKPEDCLLVGFGLFFDLQDSTGKFDMIRGVMKTRLPHAVNRFFTENGSVWESTLDGTRLGMIGIPSSENFTYLEEKKLIHQASSFSPLKMGGSNQWAVMGQFTSHKNALLACDMHLNLGIPNIWYRAAFHYIDDEKRSTEVYGATLPGTPLMVIGSNRYISWGFTNSYIDTTDIAVIQNLGNFEPLTREIEWINIKGAAPEPQEIISTPYGPVPEESYLGQKFALLWIAHDPRALNMRLTDLETSRSTLQALERSKEIKIPLLNFLAADSNGHIGWTLIGAIPKRNGFDGKIPFEIESESKGWNGLIDPNNYPTIYDPKEGFLVTANNRLLGGSWESLFGNNGFLNGIRSFQINHRLNKKAVFSEADMLKIQLDDEAFFFNRWKDLLLNLLKSEQIEDTRKKELLAIVLSWDGHSSEDSAAYYWIRSFREAVGNKILYRILQPCFHSWSHFDLATIDFEEPLWLLVSQQPDYLISPNFQSWNAELLACLDETMQKIPQNISLHELTWGKINTSLINHPMSSAIPFSDTILNMPHIPMKGDFWVPRVSGAQVGASQRMVVAPGNEEQAIFQSPGGQSGHPLSPHYSDTHRSWIEGLHDPLLPGKETSVIKLYPSLSN